MSEAEKDLQYSRRALEVAAKGIGLVSPNPLVGCVIVSSDGNVVGEGTYIYDNVAHAEQIALKHAGLWAKGGTAYVSLEPHHHHGRTPPCTEALIDAGIGRVVCPIEDPNPLVSGKGFERLREAGVEVVTGILADEAAKQNEKFICWHKKRRPFVHLKLALSLDGRLSLNGSVSTALSGSAARERVHELRHEYDAILVGGNTAAVDNPQLTDRSGLPRRRRLVRIILDNRLRLENASSLAATARETPTLVFSKNDDASRSSGLEQHGVEIVKMDARDINGVLAELYTRQIQSVLVEGGSEVAGSFVQQSAVDKFTFLYAPLVIGGDDAPSAIRGIGATSISALRPLTEITVAQLGQDIEVTGYPQRNDAG